MRREVQIVNQLGLHARPAAEFVRAAQKSACAITIHKGEESFSGLSILEVLSANLDCGAKFSIEVVGPKEEEALDRLARLLYEFKAQEDDGLI